MSKNTEKKTLEIEAADEEEARKKAYSHWQDEEGFAPERLTLKLVEERSGFLGFGSKDNLYRAELKKSSCEELEREIEYLDEEIAVEGEFEIDFTSEGIMLRITAPSGGGEKVDYYEIRERVKELQIEDVDWEAVQEKIDEPDGEWVEIAPRRPELDQDAEAEVSIGEDKLKATIDYKPAHGGEELTLSDLKSILEESGVVFGQKEEALQKVIEADSEIKEYTVAEGDPPRPGEDAELHYHFEQGEEKIGTEREDGSIDFFDRDLVTNVNKGEVLITRDPPVPGQPGRTVTGEKIEPESPADKKLVAGKNVRKKENKLVADAEGQPVGEDGRVSVTPVHRVQGDLDLNVGNIDFVGSVVVTGDVQEGFSIKAEEDIEIKGKVFAADLDAGGNIKINNGFIGKDKGTVKAGGDVQVKFIENGKVDCQGTLQVEDAVMHSDVSAGEDIIMGRGKGLIVGGSGRAASSIEASVIGSSLATTTILEVGIDPGLKEEITDLEESLEENRQNMTKTKKAIDLLEKLQEQEGELPQDKEMMYYRLKKTRKNLKEERSELEEELDSLKKRSETSRRGKIKVRERVYSGVRLVIGKAQCNVKKEISATAFVEEEGQIKQKPL